MVFDASLNIIAVDVEQPEGENYLRVVMDVGLPLPIADPVTKDAVVMPVGQIHFRIDRDTGLRWGQKIVMEAEGLKPPSNIEVATSLGDAEKVAKTLEGMKGV